MAARRKSPSKKTGSKASAAKRTATKGKPKAKGKPAKPPARAKAKAKTARAPAKTSAKTKRKASAPRAARPAVAAPPYHTLTPFLNIAGAESALAFYKKAFGAKERARMPGPDGKIMHAEMEIGDSVLMLSDAMQHPPSQSTLHLYVDDCDTVYERALQAGATEKTPLQDMFWGDRYGTVVDPFGNVWSIATHKEDLAPEEMARRMEAAMPPQSSGDSHG